jgi:predicted Rossmann fold nucleotide-binding protein DprA/Smf involved in DNA uptake
MTALADLPPHGAIIAEIAAIRTQGETPTPRPGGCLKADERRELEKMPDDGSKAERSAVIDLMGMTYVSVDELVRQSGSSPATVQMVLLEFELAGKLERGAGGKVRFTA